MIKRTDKESGKQTGRDATPRQGLTLDIINAKLAAFDELIEAAKGGLKVLEYFDVTKDCAAVGLLEAAIKKAEGL